MYYSLHYSWILLHPIYNKVTSVCSLGEEYAKKVCQNAHLLFFTHKAPTFTSWGFVIT